MPPHQATQLTALIFAVAIGCLHASPAKAANLENQTPSNAPDTRSLKTSATKENPLIHQGVQAGPCAWPTTVLLSEGLNICTGTLIHPQVVVYAAHCGVMNTITFGESWNGESLTPEFCVVNPSYGGTNDQGHDWAVCKLGEPVNLPTTPALYGECERPLLQAETEVVVVGFGETQEESSGRKRWGVSSINQIDLNEGTATIGGGAFSSVCPGDSGGPVFLRYPDGSWHTFGIASTVTGSCGGEGTYALLHDAIPWLENTTGMDLSPCHEDQSWSPSANCSDFFSAEAGEGYGTWSSWCDGSPSIEWPKTCGDSFDAVDDVPPSVSILTPSSGTTVSGESGAIDIEVQATDPGGLVQDVQLKIDGEIQEIADTAPPFVFQQVSFPNGSFLLQATARDWANNQAESEPVTIHVMTNSNESESHFEDSSGDESNSGDENEEPFPEDPNPSPNSDSGSKQSSSDDAENSEGPASNGSANPGACACSSGQNQQPPSPSGPLLPLILFALQFGLKKRLSSTNSPGQSR